MMSELIIGVIWFVAALVIVPWFVIATAPLFALVLIPFAVALGMLYAIFWTLGREQAAPEAASSDLALVWKKRLEVFVPDVPGLLEQRTALRQMLARHRRRLADGLEACACMLPWKEKVVLTVRFSRDRHHWSHQVKGLSSQEAIRRMESKLVRSGARDRSGNGHPAAEFCARSWCCNSANCPHRTPHGMSGASPRAVVGLHDAALTLPA